MSHYVTPSDDNLKPADRTFPENLGSGNTPKTPKVLLSFYVGLYLPTNFVESLFYQGIYYIL